MILSFLGFGVPVDVVSWGSMLNEAQNELILGKWWQLVAAGGTMARAGHRVLACSPTRCATRSIRSSRAGEGTDMRSRPPNRVSSPLVRVRDLSVSFRLDKHTTFEAVKGISFDIPRNSDGGAGRRVGLAASR